MEPAIYDAVIIGGGPGGSSAATFLSRAGKRVVVLEKEHFPRFHIGESLLPYNRRIFADMGVLAELEKSGFPRKFGAQFHLGNGSKGTKFVFSQGKFTREPEAIQVERSKFDDILLKHAAKSGAEVREGWMVTKFTSDADGVSVDAGSDRGETATIRGRYLLDASGRGNMTGNQEGVRVIHPRLKKLAVFGHFLGVRVDEGKKGNDTIIVRLANKWFWLIPLSAEKVSVGCVMDREEFAQSAGKPLEIFNRLVESSAPMRDRMAQARLVGEIQTTSDFSYRNKRLIGHRLLRVGDAAGFMDPIFSAGVFLAMHSGRLASEVVLKCLANGIYDEALFNQYEKQVNDSMKFYWEMVENFYTTPFMEVFLEPRHKLDLPAAVNAVLAGELEGGWSMRWRMRLFFWIVKMQRRWPLLPRISFE